MPTRSLAGTILTLSILALIISLLATRNVPADYRLTYAILVGASLISMAITEEREAEA